MNLRMITKIMQLIQKYGSHKIDFKAQWLRNGHADSVGVNTSLFNTVFPLTPNYKT